MLCKLKQLSTFPTHFICFCLRDLISRLNETHYNPLIFGLEMVFFWSFEMHTFYTSYIIIIRSPWIRDSQWMKRIKRFTEKGTVYQTCKSISHYITIRSEQQNPAAVKKYNLCLTLTNNSKMRSNKKNTKIWINSSSLSRSIPLYAWTIILNSQQWGHTTKAALPGK